jgi:hypothetical protein
MKKLIFLKIEGLVILKELRNILTIYLTFNDIFPNLYTCQNKEKYRISTCVNLYKDKYKTHLLPYNSNNDVQ